MSSDQNSAILAPDALGPDDRQEMLDAKACRVFDGDGFEATVWNPVSRRWIHRVPFRFAFIDAPEMQQPYAAEAKTFLQGLILTKRLSLHLIGKESTGYMPLDKYKRLLCMAYVTEQMQVGSVAYFLNGRCETGTLKSARPVTRNVELEMVINGWAWVLRQYAFDRQEEYMAAEENARRNRRGLWAMDNPETPWRFKERQKRERLAAERQPTFL